MNKPKKPYDRIYKTKKITHSAINIKYICTILKYSLQGTTQGNGLTGGVPPVRFSM